MTHGMIDCVSLSTVHHFPGNLIAEQHRLRYRELIVKEQWRDIYVMPDRGMEFDNYDHAATEYLIARAGNGEVVGVFRCCPTTVPCMLSGPFAYLCERIVQDDHVFEASRLVVDRTVLTESQQQAVLGELLLALLERGVDQGVRSFVTFMTPQTCVATFTRVGWQPVWTGTAASVPRGTETVRAAKLPVSRPLLERLRARNHVTGPLLNFGTGERPALLAPRVS